MPGTSSEEYLSLERMKRQSPVSLSNTSFAAQGIIFISVQAVWRPVGDDVGHALQAGW